MIFDDLVADMISNYKTNKIVTDLLNISLVFILQSYYKIPNDNNFNTVSSSIRENLKLKKFTIYRKVTPKSYSFLVMVTDTTPSSENALRL